MLTYRCFLVNWFDDKLLVIERNVSYFTPWKSNFGRHSVREQKCLVSTAQCTFCETQTLLWKHLLIILFINVETQSIHSQPQLCSLLIFDVEVIDSVHLEVLSNFQILHHGFLSVDK